MDFESLTAVAGFLVVKATAIHGSIHVALTSRPVLNSWRPSLVCSNGTRELRSAMHISKMWENNTLPLKIAVGFEEAGLCKSFSLQAWL
jgi:hypothetical protein